MWGEPAVPRPGNGSDPQELNSTQVWQGKDQKGKCKGKDCKCKGKEKEIKEEEREGANPPKGRASSAEARIVPPSARKMLARTGPVRKILASMDAILRNR